jgi:hypothetical protein
VLAKSSDLFKQTPKCAKQESKQFHSIVYLLICLLNSPKANYKANKTKETKHTQTKDKTWQLESLRL